MPDLLTWILKSNLKVLGMDVGSKNLGSSGVTRPKWLGFNAPVRTKQFEFGVTFYPKLLWSEKGCQTQVNNENNNNNNNNNNNWSYPLNQIYNFFNSNNIHFKFKNINEFNKFIILNPSFYSF